MKKIIAFSLILVITLSSVFASGDKEGKAYPSSPVTVIVPYGAGGGTDQVARALVEAAKSSFPDGIAVENKTGGNGAVGMSYGQHAKGDGRILTMIPVEVITLRHTGTGGDVNYKEWAPVLLVNSAYSAITVPVDSPYKTLEDFINAAKTKDLQIGNSGIGAIWHLAATGLEQLAGVKFTHVPFNGAGPAVTSLLGNHIDAVAVSYPEVVAQVDAGKLRVLAVLSDQRLEKAPNVPTAKEQGYDISIGTWRGIGVPKSTPKEIVSFLEDTLTKAAKSDEFVKFMNNTNNDIEILNSKDFAKKLAADDILFEKLVKSINLDN